MGLFNSGVGGDLSCGSYQGKGSSPSLSDGDGGLGLGQEGGHQTSLSNEGNMVFNRSGQSPHTKDPGVGSQGNEAPLCH